MMAKAAAWKRLKRFGVGRRDIASSSVWGRRGAFSMVKRVRAVWRFIEPQLEIRLLIAYNGRRPQSCTDLVRNGVV